MEAKKYHAFWHGAAILTIAGLVTKVLSAFYRIPYQNIAGDLAFYTYQQVYPLYGLCLVFAVYGFPAVVSKLIAEQKENGEGRITDILYISFWFLMLLCLSAFCVLFFGAASIARLMGDYQLSPIIQVAACCFLFLPFTSTVRGYFQGSHNMLPTAVSQVTEQILRVAIILSCSFYFVMIGSDAYQIGVGAMLGSAIGGAASLLVLYGYMRKEKRNVFFRSWKHITGKTSMVQMLFWQGITICVSQLVLILMQLVDSLTFYNVLTEAGTGASAAKVLKGVYDRGIPLMQLGTVAATSFSLALIPLMTEARKRGNQAMIIEKAQMAVKLAISIGIGASVGLSCIIGPTNEMLFENRAGSAVLMISAFSILFGAVAITTATILQGLGYTALPALFTVLGAIIKYIGNDFLIPVLGAKGAAVATILALLVIAASNLLLLAHVIKSSPIDWRYILQILVSSIMMALVLAIYVWIADVFIHGAGRLAAALEAIVGVGIGGAIYVFCLLKLGAITKQELQALLHKEDKLLQNEDRKERGA